MRPILYLVGDASRPLGNGPKLIAHTVNDIGAWGAGFVIRLSERWPQPEAAYRRWHRAKTDEEAGEFALGHTQFVKIPGELEAANMVAQRNVRPIDGQLPIRYDALETCLNQVAEHALANGQTVHMPRIACGHAGGLWEKIEPLIEQTLCARDIQVTVYDVIPPKAA